MNGWLFGVRLPLYSVHKSPSCLLRRSGTAPGSRELTPQQRGCNGRCSSGTPNLVRGCNGHIVLDPSPLQPGHHAQASFPGPDSHRIKSSGVHIRCSCVP